VNILWLGRTAEWSPSMSMPHIIQALNRIEKTRLVSCIRRSKDTYGTKIRDDLNIPQIVKEEKADVVIVNPFIIDYTSWKYLEDVSVPKIMICGDPATTMAQQVAFAREAKIDLAFSLLNNWIPEFEKRMKNPVLWLPYHTNIRRINNIFREEKKPIEKTNDVLWSPCESAFYPIRYEMTLINRIFPHRTISSFTIGHSGMRRLSYEDYLKIIMHSKIFIFDGTIWNYAVPKYFECMGCKTLALAIKPEDGELLHFIPNENYVEVTVYNWRAQIEYYLSHDEESKKIAKNGLATVLKYHTSDIRAKELIETIKERFF